MNVIIANDDGIQSEGIITLAKKLNKKHNVIVIAPESNRSAYSHSLSIFVDLKIEKVDVGDDIEAYSFSGTPADCVKYAALMFRDFAPDLVVSGINKGFNIGTDILYSGTVSAALEGAVHNIPAIAISYGAKNNLNYEMCAEIADKLIDKIFVEGKSKDVWNVNIPDLAYDEIKGEKFTPLGRTVYSDNYIKVREGIYQLVGEPLETVINQEDCDVEWIRKGYVTITPLIFDRTNYNALKVFSK